MREFKGTQGKFFAQSEELENGEVTVCVCDQHGNSIAFCGRSLGLPERNAELFAAAPDLLEACLRIQAQFRQAGIESKAGSFNPVEDNAAQIDAAIIKAFGR